MTPSPDLGPQEYELQLTHRQVVTVLLLLLTVMGLVAAMAYIAGRSVTAMRFAKETSAQDNRKGPSGALVVEPAAVATPTPTPSRAASPTPSAKPSPTPAPAPTPKAVAAEIPPTREPAASQVADPPPGAYLQVGSVDMGVARAFHEYLSRREFPVRIAPGASPNAFRVVIGPLGGPKEIQETEIRLKNAGFPSFLKRY